MANATCVTPSVAGNAVTADGLMFMQLGNLNHGGQELSFSPPSRPAGHTSSGVVPEAWSCTGVVVGWSPTVSQFPPDSMTPDTVNVRVPKTGTGVVVAVVVVVLLLAYVVVVKFARVERGEWAPVSAREQLEHAIRTTSTTALRRIRTLGC